MPLGHGPGVARATIGIIVAAVGPAAVLAWSTGPTIAAARAPGADTSSMVTVLALVLGWALVARLGAVVLFVLAGRLPGVLGTAAATCAQALTPRLLRSAVRVALGLGVAACPVVAAGAASAATADPAQVSAAAALPILDRLVLPTRAPASPGPRSGSAPAGAPTATGPRSVVRVRPADSLWSIAAAHLPPGSSDAQVAAAWPQWYAANRATIGPDPSLLHTGQLLREPTL